MNAIAFRVAVCTLLSVVSPMLPLKIFGEPPSFSTNGLVAHYRFDGDTVDATGRNAIGELQGAYLGTDRFGRTNRCLRVEGSNSRMVASAEGLPGGSSPRTMSFWLSAESVPGHLPAIAYYGGANATSQGFGIGYQNGALEYFWGNGNDVTGESPIPVAQWVHVAVTYDDSSNIRLYFNGAPSGSSHIPALSTTLGPLILGRWFQSGGFTSQFVGSIDDVRVYNRSLAPEELKALFDYEVTFQGSHVAVAVAQVVNGFLVGANIINGGSGYTIPPNVTVVGGSGLGATAKSTVVDGKVIAITILTAGSGYTTAPTILIDPPPIPPRQAKAIATVVNGTIGEVQVIDGGYGYDASPPPVHFLGGGGTGAKGVATVENGIVTGILITNSGTGFTTAPRVLIAVPPGYPKLTIGVSQVRVALDVLVGYSYKVQTTTDGGLTWADTGSPILALEPSYTQVFDVTGTSQLFRLVQVP